MILFTLLNLSMSLMCFNNRKRLHPASGTKEAQQKGTSASLRIPLELRNKPEEFHSNQLPEMFSTRVPLIHPLLCNDLS